jgi:hypothetical protein
MMQYSIFLVAIHMVEFYAATCGKLAAWEDAIIG